MFNGKFDFIFKNRVNSDLEDVFNTIVHVDPVKFINKVHVKSVQKIYDLLTDDLNFRYVFIVDVTLVEYLIAGNDIYTYPTMAIDVYMWDGGIVEIIRMI